MQRRALPWLITVGMSVGPLATGVSIASTPRVLRIPVSFAVSDVNGSALPCQSDGLPYKISGEIVGPATSLDSVVASSATLYLHEFSFGRFFWRFSDVAGYDYAAALAAKGHVSVLIDRLGYDASGHPVGTATCLGAQADIVAQILRQLHRGTYTAYDGYQSIAFKRLVLAGHSVGGGIAELTAYSFPDAAIAGLMLFAWADQGYTSRSIQQSVAQGADCAQGGEAPEPGAPAGYAYFGSSPEEFQQNVFHNADPKVVALATKLRNRDPCGDNATLAQVAVRNSVGIGNVAVPVLIVFGDADAIFSPGTAENQASAFRASPSVSVSNVKGSGHALTLERSASIVQSTAASWLTKVGA